MSRIFANALDCRRLLLAVALAAVTALGFAAQADASQVAAVQAHFMWSKYDHADIVRQMDQAKSMGAGMLRVDVGWSSIEEEGKGQFSSYHLEKLDDVVDQANARGLKLLLTFWQTPCWASSAPASLKQDCSGSWWDRDVQLYPPNNPQDYADALAVLVRRYGDRVAAWEIWNEPNQDDYLKGDDPKGSYAALVRAAYPAAKAADPTTTIVAGSLADADFKWTKALYDRGVKGYFDAWSVHPYSADRSPLDPVGPDYAQNSFVRGVPAVRDAMLSNGDDKPLWLTEFGWSTCNVRDGEPWENCVDPSVQARYLSQAFERMRSWSYVQVGVWFNVEDTGNNDGSRIDNYGLLSSDGRPKPAVSAFRSAASDLDQSLPPGPAPDAATDTTGDTGSGDSAAPPVDRIRLTLRRRGGNVYATGHAPPRVRVQLLAYRYNARRHKFSVKPSYRSRVRADRDGNFLRRLPARLRNGRWRVLARTKTHAVRPASHRLG
jgi:hypothetical protein